MVTPLGQRMPPTLRARTGSAGTACAALALATLACGVSSSTSGGGEAPKPTAVVPNVAYSTVATAVEIDGTGFLAKATQPSGGGSPVVDTHHRAWLDDVELTNVTWDS